tara:strand:+ start:352 stop:621 length:270 start_codon:yes stop_codon:yes gene_type:complete
LIVNVVIEEPVENVSIVFVNGFIDNILGGLESFVFFLFVVVLIVGEIVNAVGQTGKRREGDNRVHVECSIRLGRFTGEEGNLLIVVGIT